MKAFEQECTCTKCKKVFMYWRKKRYCFECAEDVKASKVPLTLPPRPQTDDEQLLSPWALKLKQLGFTPTNLEDFRRSNQRFVRKAG